MKNAKFIKSAVKPSDFPPEGKDEIAVVGRSNVGKSSLLNHLFQKKGLVKTSATPGKTQLINFFDTEKYQFVDLPGYGYARVPQKIREEWGPMIEGYFKKRASLKLILLLIDIRRVPDEEDFAMLEYVQAAGKPVIVIFTKTDKLNQSDLHHQTKLLTEAFKPLPVLSYRVDHDKPREKLIALITGNL